MADERTRDALLASIQGEETPIANEVTADYKLKRLLRGAVFSPPTHTRIITVSNQKGGVGKTTTAVNIAAALADGGLRVLVIDSDPQGNASTALGVPHGEGTTSLYECLLDDVPIAEAVVPCPDFDSLFVLPATIDLAGAEIELVMMDDRVERLEAVLHTYLREHYYDYVFIDCPPSLGLLTLNAFVAAREVLIPIQTEYYALEGLSQLLANIERINTSVNPALHVSTIVLTMNDRRTNLAREVASEVRRYFPRETLQHTIPRSVRISEAPSHGKTIITYDRNGSGALAYRAVAHEIAERGKEMTVHG
ncbi:MAG: AAA family ATPase [Bowdeniella nasicola]|nr:AAA family ATPase [Bowdeniella nasicola]